MATPAFAKLSAMSFPKTINDLSFKSRVDNATDGYKPFLDKKAYQELNIVPGEEIYTDRIIATEEAKSENSAIKINTPTYEDTNATPPNQNEIVYTGYTIGGGRVIQNYSVIGGSCYPANRDRNFTNTILTTGKYEKTDPAFEKAMITLFRKEGGCGTIKNDPCGYTCYGIGSDPKCSGIVVSSRAEAENFYYQNIWTKYKIYKLPDVISPDIFIAAVSSGPGTALSQFRVFLGLSSSTGPVDDAMVYAVQKYDGNIHDDWMNKRDQFLQKVAQKRYNGAIANGYKNAIELKRKNGCHVQPQQPLMR